VTRWDPSTSFAMTSSIFQNDVTVLERASPPVQKLQLDQKIVRLNRRQLF